MALLLGYISIWKCSWFAFSFGFYVCIGFLELRLGTGLMVIMRIDASLKLSFTSLCGLD